MEGRDIGTVVVPATPFKFYLDADPAVRAERRHAELAGKGATTDPAEVARQLAERDARDSSRSESPLQAAPDACHINTGGLLPEEVVDVMLAEIRQRSGRTSKRTRRFGGCRRPPQVDRRSSTARSQWRGPSVLTSAILASAMRSAATAVGMPSRRAIAKTRRTLSKMPRARRRARSWS